MGKAGRRRRKDGKKKHKEDSGGEAAVGNSAASKAAELRRELAKLLLMTKLRAPSEDSHEDPRTGLRHFRARPSGLRGPSRDRPKLKPRVLDPEEAERLRKEAERRALAEAVARAEREAAQRREETAAWEARLQKWKEMEEEERIRCVEAADARVVVDGGDGEGEEEYLWGLSADVGGFRRVVSSGRLPTSLLAHALLNAGRRGSKTMRNVPKGCVGAAWCGLCRGVARAAESKSSAGAVLLGCAEMACSGRLVEGTRRALLEVRKWGREGALIEVVGFLVAMDDGRSGKTAEAEGVVVAGAEAVKVWHAAALAVEGVGQRVGREGGPCDEWLGEGHWVWAFGGAMQSVVRDNDSGVEDDNAMEALRKLGLDVLRVNRKDATLEAFACRMLWRAARRMYIVSVLPAARWTWSDGFAADLGPWASPSEAWSAIGGVEGEEEESDIKQSSGHSFWPGLAPIPPPLGAALEALAEGIDAESALGRGLLRVPVVPGGVAAFYVEIARERARALADRAVTNETVRRILTPAWTLSDTASSKAQSAEAADVAAARLAYWAVRAIIRPLQSSEAPPRDRLNAEAAAAAGRAARASVDAPVGAAEASNAAKEWAATPVDVLTNQDPHATVSLPWFRTLTESSLQRTLRSAKIAIRTWQNIAQSLPIPYDLADDANDRAVQLLGALNTSISRTTNDEAEHPQKDDHDEEEEEHEDGDSTSSIFSDFSDDDSSNIPGRLPSDRFVLQSMLKKDSPMLPEALVRRVYEERSSQSWALSPKARLAVVPAEEDPFALWPPPPPPLLPDPPE